MAGRARRCNPATWKAYIACRQSVRPRARGVRGLPWHGDSWVGPQRRIPTSPVFPSGRPLLALGLVPWSLAGRPLVAWLFACSGGGGFSSPAHGKRDKTGSRRTPATRATGLRRPLPKNKNTERVCRDPLPALPLLV